MVKPSFHIKTETGSWQEAGIIDWAELRVETATFHAIGAKEPALTLLRDALLNHTKICARAVFGESDVRCKGLLMELSVTPIAGDDQRRCDLTLQLRVESY